MGDCGWNWSTLSLFLIFSVQSQLSVLKRIFSKRIGVGKRLKDNQN
jgi:hypothetical protein